MMGLLLFLLVLSCGPPSPSTLFASADALDDLWEKYVQSQQKETASSSTYEVDNARRERNLDHWDAPTLAAYLGMDVATGQPLPSPDSKEAKQAAAKQGASITEGGFSASITEGGLSGQASSPPLLTDEYVGHDAAVLFYAQWCQNCHALAPIWDQIATLVKAGSTQSNLIMALFDCELNAQHTKLCNGANVQAYPTLMFVGSGAYHDTDPVTATVLGKDRSAGPFGATTLRRTVKFQGDWRYGDEILDWINAMRGLSSWHKFSDSGWMRFLRRGLLGRKGSSKLEGEGDGNSLPVGVPPNFRAKAATTSTTGAEGARSNLAADTAKITSLESQLKGAQDEKKTMEKAAGHASILIDAILFPVKATTEEVEIVEGDDETAKKTTMTSIKDPFAILHSTDGWEKGKGTLDTANTVKSAKVGQDGWDNLNEHPLILRNCIIDLALDYCNRFMVHDMSDYLLEQVDAGRGSEEADTVASIEATLKSRAEEKEPYCAIFEKCFYGDFAEEECRPATNPLKNEGAQLYLSSCFNPLVQDEYGVAFGLLKEGEKMEKKYGPGASGGSGSSANAADTSGEKKALKGGGGGGWGIG